MDGLHWQSLSKKLPATATSDSQKTDTIALTLATLGAATYNRNDPICVVPPKVTKASKVERKEGDIAGVIALSFANGNAA
jgi:hypothetical protein